VSRQPRARVGAHIEEGAAGVAEPVRLVHDARRHPADVARRHGQHFRVALHQRQAGLHQDQHAFGVAVRGHRNPARLARPLDAEGGQQMGRIDGGGALLKHGLAGLRNRLTGFRKPSSI